MPIWDAVGMTSAKPFGILVEGWGEGVAAERAVIARDRKPVNPTPISTHMRQVHANLGCPGMGWDDPGGGRVVEIG